MKKLLSLFLIIVLLVGNTAHASSKYSTENDDEVLLGAPIIISRTVNGMEQLIRTISADNAKLFSESVTVKESTNDTYNEYDVTKMREFLEIEDPYGIKNGEKLARSVGTEYDADDPSTWGCIYWTDEGAIEYIEFWAGNFCEMDEDESMPVSMNDTLYGVLDVSGMQSLCDVSLGQNMIEGIISDDCPNLTDLYCGMLGMRLENQLSFVSAKNCESLFYLGADYTNVENIDISGDSMLYELMLANCEQLSNISLSDCRDSLGMLCLVDTAIESIDLSYMTALSSAQFNDCRNLQSINLEGITADFELVVANTPIATLDLSDCTNMNGLYFMDTQDIDFSLETCHNLQFINGDRSGITALDASASELLTFIALQEMPKLESLRIKPYGNNLNVTVENGKLSSVAGAFNFMGYNDIGIRADPYEDSQQFIGWFDADTNEIISTEQYLAEGLIDRLQSESVNLIARFTGGSEPSLPGDVDGSGTVEAVDAIMALRCAMGIMELTPEQFEAADMDGSGTIALDDAIIILRTAMGLLG